jgi:uroporphyrinogen-III synthase
VGESRLNTDVDHGETGGSTEITRHGIIRALVTRPREEAESLASALAARGVVSVIQPMMEVHYRAPRAPDLADVQAILCTSANGVRALARIIGERDRPLLAVGDATAARARAEGFTDVASAGGSIDDLIRLAALRLRPQDGWLLHVAGEIVAGDLTGSLRAHGFTIERSILYETRPVEALSLSVVRALRSGMIDFALFFSPRTAEIFVTLSDSAGVAGNCRLITALSISAATDAALSALSWRERQVAQEPSQPALLDRLDRVLGARQSN